MLTFTPPTLHVDIREEKLITSVAFSHNLTVVAGKLLSYHGNSPANSSGGRSPASLRAPTFVCVGALKLLSSSLCNPGEIGN